MKIYAKSKFDKNIYDKIKKGAKAIELHLDDNFVANPTHWDEEIVSNVVIDVVHAPLCNGNDTNIERLENREILRQTCEFAKKIAIAQNHSVLVVCHLGTNPKLLKQLGVYDELVQFMQNLAEEYKELEFAIENITRFKNDFRNGILGFKDVDFMSPITLAKDINHPRVGTCLDTCHALIDIRLIEHAAAYVDKEAQCKNAEYISEMEAFFDANKDTIKLIHLSNAKTHGLDHDHGMPFAKEDSERLREILRLYYKYDYKCPITLEVRESDYTDAKNFEITYQTVLKTLAEIQ